MSRDFAAESRPPATPRPPKAPPLPRRPPTIPPTPHFADNIFDLAASLGFKDLGLVPQGVRLAIAADSEGRTGVRPVPGAVPFATPQPLGPRRFGDGRPRPGQPGPPPQPRPTGPVPHPPPPGLLWLPALMLPSLLLLAAIDYTAWAAWWV